MHFSSSHFFFLFLFEFKEHLTKVQIAKVDCYVSYYFVFAFFFGLFFVLEVLPFFSQNQKNLWVGFKFQVFYSFFGPLGALEQLNNNQNYKTLSIKKRRKKRKREEKNHKKKQNNKHKY